MGYSVKLYLEYILESDGYSSTALLNKGRKRYPSSLIYRKNMKLMKQFFALGTVKSQLSFPKSPEKRFRIEVNKKTTGNQCKLG